MPQPTAFQETAAPHNTPAKTGAADTATTDTTADATQPHSQPLPEAGTQVLLCFDIGNTSAHWALFANGVITRRGDIPTAQISEQGATLLDDLPHAQLGACSVVPAATEQLKALAAVRQRSLFILTADNAPTLAITYPKPQEIGPDRLANAIAAQKLYGAPSIVIDMGTATTFDIVSSKDGYIGGIIAPGLAAMTHYLHEKTALLPKLDPNTLEQGPRIGQSTTEAMAVGTTRGYPGMIAALLAAVQEELAARGEPHPAVILTGGASRGFIRKAFAAHPADPDLTLKGLAIALHRS